jgi:hypothetical protein
MEQRLHFGTERGIGAARVRQKRAPIRDGFCEREKEHVLRSLV